MNLLCLKSGKVLESSEGEAHKEVPLAALGQIPTINTVGCSNSLTNGDRGTIRTCDRLLRRQMLYPAELRDPRSGSLAGNSINVNQKDP